VTAKYRAVLSAPGALRLFASAVVGRLPQGMSSLAILLLVRGVTHSYAAAGVSVGAFAFASAAGAPVVGRLVDRFGPRRVLGPCAWAQACVYVMLVLAAGAGAGAGVLILLSASAGALLPPIAPVVRALLREVFEDVSVRETAYALEAVIQELVWITGPLVVALVIAFLSPSAAVMLLGAVGVSGTSLFVRAPVVKSRRSRDVEGGRGPSRLSAELRVLLIPVALTGLGLGAVEVGLPSLALHAGSRPAAGLLLALWSVGSMAGGLWYGARVWNSSLASRYRGLLMIAVLCTAPLIAARSLDAGIVCSVLAGLTIAPVFSCQYALVGRTVTAGNETYAFTWVSAALVGGLAAGSAVGGAVIGAAGVSAPFVVACAATVLAAALAFGVRGAPDPVSRSTSVRVECESRPGSLG
jgi:MFS family permease